MKYLTFISYIFLFPCLQAKGQSVPNTTYEPKEIKIPALKINAHSGLPEMRLFYYIIGCVPVENISEYVVVHNNMPEIFYPMSPLPVKQVYTRREIDALPYIDIKDIVASSARVFQIQRGGPVNIRNGGEEGTLYIIDGMVIMNY